MGVEGREDHPGRCKHRSNHNGQSSAHEAEIVVTGDTGQEGLACVGKLKPQLALEDEIDPDS